jgi:hypothetical protein
VWLKWVANTFVQRKIDSSDNRSKKRVKGADGERKVPKKIAKATSTKTPNKKRGDSFASSDPAAPSSDRRRSGRSVVQKSYIESSDEEVLDDVVENGDEEMEDASGTESEPSPEPEADSKLSPEPEPEPEPETKAVRFPRTTRKREVPVVEVSDEESSEEEGEEADSRPPKSASRKKTTPQKPSPKKSSSSTGKKEKAEKIALAPVKAKTPVRPMPKAKAAKKAPATKSNGRATRGQKTKEAGLYDVPSDSD